MKIRRQALAATAILCALVASLVIAVAPAAAEAPDSAPIRNVDDGGLSWPETTGPESPEQYPISWGELGAGTMMRQVSDQLVVVEDIESGVIDFSIKAPLEHDAFGSMVPTSLRLSEGNVITFVVSFRAGNPAAGGAPFVYPITEGAGWEGGWKSFSALIPGEFERAERQIIEANPPATLEPLPVITCKVPTLRGYSLRAAKNRLRAAHCGIGAVRLAAGAAAGKGKVVKQFHPAGTELAAGAPVAVKLGVGR
jgi:PASTA domain